MPRHDTNRRAPARRGGKAAAALLLALLAALLLAACGGGSKSTSTAATSTSASSTAPAQGRGQFAARSAALRTCLKNAGITLPERQPGQQGRRAGGPLGLGGSGGGGSFKLPAGVTRAKLLEAMKKCGGGDFAGRRFGARDPQRLAKFAACMRQNGVNLPAPNTSGKGPVFDTSGIDTTSETFKKADAKCAGELRPSGTGAPGGGSGGAPPEEPPA